jgi:hypothetical protein
MGRPCGTLMGNRNAYESSVGNPERKRDPYENFGFGERIILKWILGSNGMEWTGLI